MSGEVNLGQSFAIYDNGQRQDPVNNHGRVHSGVSLGFERSFAFASVSSLQLIRAMRCCRATKEPVFF